MQARRARTRAVQAARLVSGRQLRRCQCTATAAAAAAGSAQHRRWPALPASAPAALRAALEDDARELCALPIDPACVSTLSCPTDFYAQLLRGAAGAQRRILLASLYIGTGEKEQALLDAVAAACDRVPSMQATLLVDALRTQRVERSGVSSLDTIVERCGHHIRGDEAHPAAAPAASAAASAGELRVFLYHTHLLGEIGKRVLPPRWNEGISLQHCKVYLFDDTVILSGANLSDTYFTDRDDRYVVFSDCAPLAEYVHELFASERGLPAACYSVHRSSQTNPAAAATGLRGGADLRGSHESSSSSSGWDLGRPLVGHDPVTGGRAFSAATERHLRSFLKKQRQSSFQQAWRRHETAAGRSGGHCTWVVPALQMAAHSINQDEPLLAEVVSGLGDNDAADTCAAGSGDGSGDCGSLVLSSAYLNLTASQFKRSPLAEALAAPGCR
jgi:hypothetical protein